MAKNVAGAEFVSKGIRYVLRHGPKGKLRPYTLGPVKAAARTGNPYVIVASVICVVVVEMGLRALLASWK